MKTRARPSGFDAAIPAQLAAFVDVLGEARAIDFLLEFGGATFYLASDPKGGSEIERRFGAAGRKLILALRERTDNSYMRIPTAKPWIAQRLRQGGAPISAIARRLHVTDATVRGWLPRDTERQMRLL